MGMEAPLRALVRSGSVDFLRNNGVDTLSYFQVDNPRPVYRPYLYRPTPFEQG